MGQRGGSAAAQAARPAFRPSRHAFAFSNSWPAGPAIAIRTPVGAIGIGNAARGLCGGMVFAALDYWQAGRHPPASQPAAGTPLFRFIVRRLIQSWHIPHGVAAYYRGMLSSDGQLATRTIARQWPRVQARLDAGQPSALGVVTVASANPLLLGRNHQVLAYSYVADGHEVTLLVYDPNSGPDDGVVIRFSTASSVATPVVTAAPLARPRFTHSINVSWPVRGFFLTRYGPADPPAG